MSTVASRPSTWSPTGPARSWRRWWEPVSGPGRGRNAARVRSRRGRPTRQPRAVQGISASREALPVAPWGSPGSPALPLPLDAPHQPADDHAEHDQPGPLVAEAMRCGMGDQGIRARAGGRRRGAVHELMVPRWAVPCRARPIRAPPVPLHGLESGLRRTDTPFPLGSASSSRNAPRRNGRSSRRRKA